MIDFKKANFTKLCKYISPRIGNVLLGITGASELCEIRIRADMPVVLIFTSDRKFITSSGRLTSFFSNDLLFANANDTQDTFNMMCKYSVHAHTQSIANGYITLDGGNRVGVYGTAVTQNGKVVSLRNVRGLNIRIAGRFDGVAKPIADKLYSEQPHNLLICGPPSSGKTTMLKDLSRILSDDMCYKISVVDERCELSSSYIGFNTDVLSCYPKAEGIMTAVRTLSPDIIICDEIGTLEEIDAVADGMNSGVCFAMSIHCRSLQELTRKPQYKKLNSIGAVDSCVLLGKGKCTIEKITDIEELENENNCADGSGSGLCTYGAIHSIQT